jgi:iron(III) transport system ATP-binding protein
VMNAGVIDQWDVAYNLYHRPTTRFVADFVGQGVLLRGRARGDGHIETELGMMETTNLPLGELQDGSFADVLVRPDDILHDDASPAQAEVLHKAFRGAEILYTLKLASGAKVLSLVPSHHNHEIGQKIGIKLEIDHVVAFPAL